MAWIKKGLIFNVDSSKEWNQTHAQVPVVDVLKDRLRIYYATRNKSGKANISFIEVDINDPKIILYQHDEVLFDFGEIGTFDDSGIMPTCIIDVEGKKYLYYIGWTTRGTVPYHNSIGLAISEDGGKSFKKAFLGPIITVNHKEPYFSGTAFVRKENNGFRMWYLSCIGWKKKNDNLEPLYEIKYADSNDGINWNQNNLTAIKLKNNEGGLASAAVIKTKDGYEMYYCYRGIYDYRNSKEESYRIGFAESQDGIQWIRNDSLAGIDISKEGWDSEMIAYPYIVELKGKRLLFYNGNGFGQSGFGYAVWE